MYNVDNTFSVREFEQGNVCVFVYYVSGLCGRYL